MEVIVTRTGDRRYSIEARGTRLGTLEMSPAPGYDDHLPHDLVHFVVEDELGLSLGVFGQLAAGGDAGTFRLPASPNKSRERTRKQRRLKRRGERLAHEGRCDSEFSEKAVAICLDEWHTRAAVLGHSRRSGTGSAHAHRLHATLSEAEKAELSEEAVRRICNRLTQVSELWSQLAVGGSLVLHWTQSDMVPPSKPHQKTETGRRAAPRRSRL